MMCLVNTLIQGAQININSMSDFSSYVANNPAPATKGPGALSQAVGDTGTMLGNTAIGLGKSVIGQGAQDASLIQTLGRGAMNAPSWLANKAQTMFTGKSNINPTPFTAQGGYGLDFSPVSQMAQSSNPEQQGASFSLPVLNAATGAKALYDSAPSLINTLSGGRLLSNENSVAETAKNVSNIWQKAYSTGEEGALTANSGTAVSSRVADATPAYDKSLVGENVKNPEGKIVPRVNEGTGLGGQRTVTTSASEAQSGQELNNLKNYPDNGTALEKSQAVGKGINTEAESMRSGLQAEDKTNPLDTNAEKIKISELVRQNLPEDIQAKVGVNTPEENSMLKGMSEKAGSPIPEGGKYDLRAPGETPNFPKTAAGNYYSKVMDSLNEYDGTREGKLNLRQAIDSAYESARGKLAWGSDSQNALDEVNTSIRDSLNKDLAATTEDTDTQASLKKQTNLYRAKDVLNSKAQAEAPSEIGRFFQQHPILHRLATREFMRSATSIITAGAGVGILTKLITDSLKGK